MGSHLSEPLYVRQRLAPQPGDMTYLHLVDLRKAMSNIATDRPLTILDYGCGGSPYRALFPNADYRRADFANESLPAMDYALDQSGKVNESDASFDFILSTQVLEHVPEPTAYLRECFRLLKPRGRLYLTTHGSYPDHNCPFDYRRWTADGLAKDIRNAGFNVVRLEKQTTGPRAFFLQFDYETAGLRVPPGSFFAAYLWLFRTLVPLLRPWIHRMCDRYFQAHSVVTDKLNAHRTYAVTACLAQKP